MSLVPKDPEALRKVAEVMIERSETKTTGSPVAQHLLLVANAYATLAVEARLARLDEAAKATAKKAPAKKSTAKKTTSRKKAADASS